MDSGGPVTDGRLHGFWHVYRNKGLLGERNRQKQEVAAKYGARVDSGELRLKEAFRLAALENEDVTYYNVRDAQQHRKRQRGKAPSTLGRMEMRSIITEGAGITMEPENSGGGGAAADEEGQVPAVKLVKVFVPFSHNGQVFECSGQLQL